MTRTRLIGAAVVLSSMLAGPAMAQRLVAHPAQSTYCATREAGNPYIKTAAARPLFCWSWRRQIKRGPTMIKLTKEREIDLCLSVHPDEER
jgi:hypothetical protein